MGVILYIRKYSIYDLTVYIVSSDLIKRDYYCYISPVQKIKDNLILSRNSFKEHLKRSHLTENTISLLYHFVYSFHILVKSTTVMNMDQIDF